MADRIALAITQSQAYEDERRARHEAELAHRRLAFLAEASTLLATSLDYESTLRAVARLAVPHLADWCVVDVAVDGPGWSGSRSRTSIRTRSRSSRSSAPLAAAQETIRSARTRCCAAERRSWRPRSPTRCSPTPSDDEHLEVIRDIGLRSYMCVPMWGARPRRSARSLS